MSRILTDITEIIGDTPLIELSRYSAKRRLYGRILAKIETRNPFGSVKDRAAWAIIRDAELRGVLKPGGEIVDTTSGNTGISMGALAAARGYQASFYASDNISPDKLALLRAFGSKVVEVPNVFFTDPNSRDLMLARIKREHPTAYFTDQASNPVNARVHYATTGPEIWRDTDGEVDFLVGGVGTGGTVSGSARYLKERKPSVELVVAEPGPGSVPTSDNAYPRQIDGVHEVRWRDASRLPGNFDRSLVDEYVSLETAEAIETSRAVAREEGLMVGLSAGAALHAATSVAERPENKGKTIVAIVYDSAERYLSAGIFDDRPRGRRTGASDVLGVEQLRPANVLADLQSN